MIKTKVKEIKQIAGEAIVSPNLEKEFKHEYEIIRALLNFSNRELYPGYDDKMSKLWSKKDVKLETEEIKMIQIVPELIISFENKVILDLIHETQEGIKQNRIDKFDYPKDADYKQVKA